MDPSSKKKRSFVQTLRKLSHITGKPTSEEVFVEESLDTSQTASHNEEFEIVLKEGSLEMKKETEKVWKRYHIVLTTSSVKIEKMSTMTELHAVPPPPVHVFHLLKVMVKYENNLGRLLNSGVWFEFKGNDINDCLVEMI